MTGCRNEATRIGVRYFVKSLLQSFLVLLELEPKLQLIS
jgi:hypothetical protein